MCIIIVVKLVRMLTLNEAHQNMQLASISSKACYKTTKRKASVQVYTANLKARPIVYIIGLHYELISVAS